MNELHNLQNHIFLPQLAASAGTGSLNLTSRAALRSIAPPGNLSLSLFSSLSREMKLLAAREDMESIITSRLIVQSGMSTFVWRVSAARLVFGIGWTCQWWEKNVSS